MAESEEDRHLSFTGGFDCDPSPLPTLRHSASHVMAQAVKRLFPDVKLAIGPAIEDGFYYDLCRGPHVPSTGHVTAFKLLSSSGAYWRGDERNPMLQRIYGTAWLTPEELDRHLWRLEEAKKRDHRKLGRELDLFDFFDVAPGAPFWLPKGMVLVRELERF